VDSRSILLYLVMSNPTEVFITNARGHCYVRVDWSGLTLSKIPLGLSLFSSVHGNLVLMVVIIKDEGEATQR
jgi:hypothetical protein